VKAAWPSCEPLSHWLIRQDFLFRDNAHTTPWSVVAEPDPLVPAVPPERTHGPLVMLALLLMLSVFVRRLPADVR
jgi:hypothetical protein